MDINPDTGRGFPPHGARIQRQDSPYAWYVCAVLCLCFAFSYMDRAVLPLLFAPIERSLGLTDTTMGLLQGAAFATFYALFGFPLARVADTGNRRNLILCGLIAWCAATCACGLARTPGELFAARICVAIGEAVLSPAAVSMLSDYFSPRRRTTALSIYAVGVFLGGGLALGGGGTLIRAIGPDGATLGPLGWLDTWKLVFIILGASGVVLVLPLLKVREPLRLADDGSVSEARNSLREVVEEFARKKMSIAATVVGFAAASMGATTIQAWVPTMLLREHGWPLGKAGQLLGIMALLLSPLGALIGARLAERLSRAGRSDGKLIVGILSAGFCAVSSIGLTLPWEQPALVAIAATIFVVSFNFGLVQAALSELVPNRMRAIASACYIAMSNLLAATCGPLLVGVLNDHWFHDPMKVATSIRLVAPGAFCLAALILHLGRRHYRADVKPY
jgi:MFS family permease